MNRFLHLVGFTSLGLLIGVAARSSAADMSVQLTTIDGSSKFSVLNSTGGEIAAIDSLGRATFGSIAGGVDPAQISSGLLPMNVVASSISVNAVLDGSIVGMTASKLTGSLPALDGSSLTNITASVFSGTVTASQLTGIINNARLDGSSVTLQGNVFNTASHLVQTDSSNRLPALDGSQLTSLTAAVLTGTVTANQITGTVNNARLDSSSVTLQGNVFNTASHLVQTDAFNRLPALDGSQLTSLTASVLSGTVTANQITGTINNARLDSSSVTLAGNAFNVANGLTKLDSTGNLALPSGGSITVGSLRGTIVPSGSIILSTSTCPSGFSEFVGARGFYLAGVPAGGSVGQTVGSAMTDLANPNHSHSVTSTPSTALLNIGLGNLVTSVAATTGNVDRGTVAPYFQIRLCLVP